MDVFMRVLLEDVEEEFFIIKGDVFVRGERRGFIKKKREG